MSGPPLPDPHHIETRLLVVAEMLDKAIHEVRRTMAEIKGEVSGGTPTPPGPAAANPGPQVGGQPPPNPTPEHHQENP